MFSKKFDKMLYVLSFAGLLAVPSLASAGAVITSGNIALGVNNEGHLNVMDPTGAVVTSGSSQNGYVGIAYKFPDGTWRDATSPGCLCEGWGVSGSGVSGSADIDEGGVVNLTVDSFTATASSITSKVHLTSTPALTVTQAYAPAAAAPGVLFDDKVTITNTGATTITNLQYVRVMDWDVPPTEFNEFVTIQGTATTTDLVTSHDNGFGTADPLVTVAPITLSTLNTDFISNGPIDHGAYFLFNFGNLAAGASQTFDIFYGAAGNQADVLAALSAVGIELYSLGQSNTTGNIPGGPNIGTPATYTFGFEGVGGQVIIPSTVPEPGTILLLGSGLVGLAFWRKRRNS